MPKQEAETFYPRTVMEWREWLAQNHISRSSVWLVQYNKASKKPSLSWSEAVDAALCYGWIDSKKVSIDKEKSHQFFSKRKARSTWSKINKAKVAHLIEAGLMTQAGFDAVETARQNGSWTILDQVEALQIPEDLERAFEAREGSKEFFLGLSKSAKKSILQWLVLARRPDTRQKRIDEIAELASKGAKPKPF